MRKGGVREQRKGGEEGEKAGEDPAGQQAPGLPHLAFEARDFLEQATAPVPPSATSRPCTHTHLRSFPLPLFLSFRCTQLVTKHQASGKAPHLAFEASDFLEHETAPADR